MLSPLSQYAGYCCCCIHLVGIAFVSFFQYELVYLDGWMAWRALFCGHNNRWRRVVNEKSKLYCLFAGWLVSRLTGQLLSRSIFRVLRNIGMLMLHMTQIWRSMIAKAHAPLPTNYCSAICSLLSPVQLVMSLRKIQPIYLFLDVWVCVKCSNTING